MAKPRSRGQRLVALVIAVILIGGGAATLGTAGSLAASKVGAAIAILAGLFFLTRVSSRSS
jgi:hypothetical protein